MAKLDPFLIVHIIGTLGWKPSEAASQVFWMTIMVASPVETDKVGSQRFRLACGPEQAKRSGDGRCWPRFKSHSQTPALTRYPF